MTVPQAKFEGLVNEPGKKVLRPHVRVGATLYPHADDPIYPARSTERRHLNWDRDQTEGTITRWSWSKRMGQPSGQWSITAKLGRQATLDILGGDLLDGDWIDITVMRNGRTFPICRGVIDSAREQTQSIGGVTYKTVTLTGRDHGALFESPIAWNNIFAQNVSQLLLGIHTGALKHNVGGSPSDLFALWLDATFGQPTSATQSSWKFPPALAARTRFDRFGQEVRVRNESETRGAYFNEMSAWTQSGQSLHQVLRQWCNPMLNEWWYDLESPTDPIITPDGFQVEATIRERPFITTELGHNSPWFNLPELEVPNWMVESTDLGRSGQERFTVYEINADYSFGNAQEQTALAPPLWNPSSVGTHGIKPYLENTKHIQKVNGQQAGWVAERNAWQQIVASWFAPNPYWLSGSVNLSTMLPEARIGERFRLKTGNDQNDLTAYIEGVEHDFEFSADGSRGPRSRTRLQLTRGFRGTDDDRVVLVRDSVAELQEGF